MELSECISMTKDIIVALAAVSTVVIAAMGLNKWKAELKGKVYFTAAKNLIRAVYNFRDKMSYIRSGINLDNEFPKGYNHFTKNKKEIADALRYIYQNKFKPLIEAGQDLDVYTLEAEALWGKDIKQKCQMLRNTFFKLELSIKMHIDNIESEDEILKDAKDLENEIKNDMYESTKKDDSLSLEIVEAIKDIESIIRPYLDKNL